MHFCRFLFKMISRMDENSIEGVETLKEHFACLIHTKLTALSSLDRFNSYQLDSYREYRDTSDFKKISSITKQYE